MDRTIIQTEFERRYYYEKSVFQNYLGITLSVLASVLFLAHKSEFFKDDSALYDEFDSTLD